MKVFLAFAFRDQDRELVGYVDRLLASQFARRIIPVMIGTDIELPPRLEGRKAIQVSSAHELSAIVDQVLEASPGKSASL